ncbi:uncharacterized protein LOC107271023 [Cephus cinctus]|uniref:Uncharacterized protein LOC107271023 n=1 Tax=Cephus cinctus TaxID=211228 RepID=A0AAJ7FPM3_CEPCN|nr:uncharacterized protein LOC107271023 [Cephus cinctus]XP_024944041.1 uncharacterized protein LOC107271023 [Cephus cinctus]
MNGALVVVGMVVVSILLASILAYESRATRRSTEMEVSTKNSLDEDLQDILEFVPLKEVEKIINDYLMYDKQIHETVQFVDEMKNFVLEDLKRIPGILNFMNYLQSQGLDMENWSRKIKGFWMCKPNFVESNQKMASGGLTTMINRIQKILPKEELHEYLRQKLRYSRSFRNFIILISSDHFVELCESVEKSVGLQREYFWATEAGIETTFTLELLKDLYVYLTETLV